MTHVIVDGDFQMADLVQHAVCTQFGLHYETAGRRREFRRHFYISHHNYFNRCIISNQKFACFLGIEAISEFPLKYLSFQHL